MHDFRSEGCWHSAWKRRGPRKQTWGHHEIPQTKIPSLHHHPSLSKTEELMLLRHLPKPTLSNLFPLLLLPKSLAQPTLNNPTLIGNWSCQHDLLKLTLVPALTDVNVPTAPRSGSIPGGVCEGQTPMVAMDRTVPQTSAAMWGSGPGMASDEPCSTAPRELSPALHSGAAAGLSRSLREDIINSPAGTLH